jgi:inosose dehydratase
MASSFSRRSFLATLGVAAAGAALPIKSPGNDLIPGIVSVTDSINFNHLTAETIRFGYAAITWNGNDAQAIKEVSEVGFTGIQLRSNILKEYGERPKALRELLDQYHLEMVALSSGGVSITAPEKDEIDKHVNNAKFVHDVGGRYLQVTDSSRPKDRKPQPEDFRQLGKVITEIGKRTADLGVPLGYHNHMDSLGEGPGEVDQIMDAADPRYVRLELDIAHYQQGGGDPVKAIRTYRDRLLFLHIKDVENLSSPDSRGHLYRFVELGRGRVDLPAVFKALHEAKFRGWAVVELDSVPDASRTAKDCAVISKKYLEEKLKLKV